ncbi:MAG: hypothetical protein J6T57_02010 [Alphaproteobacteria bacterium]|nr:hypothetical protein [Alphaproteobacteria bacterium]
MAYDIPVSMYRLTPEDKLNQLAFAELQVLGTYYQGLTDDVHILQNLEKDKNNTEHTRDHVSALLKLCPPKPDYELEHQWGMGSNDPVGIKIQQLKRYVKSFKTGDPDKNFDTPTAKNEWTANQVSVIALYGVLCNLKNCLDNNSNIKFNKQERNEIQLLSEHIANIQQELPNYLSKKPADHCEIKDEYDRFSHNTLYKISTDTFSKGLQKYFQYNGNIFSDVICIQDDFVRACDGSYSYTVFNRYKSRTAFDAIATIIKASKKHLIVTPIGLYLTYVQSVLNTRLMRSDMQNVENDKQEAIAQLTKVTNLPQFMQIQMAKQYLAKQK